MCGIFGYVSDKTEIDLLQKMGNALSHRGPDGEGYYSSDRLHMGIKRLAIIDLETGDQPISNEDKSIWIVFNGEIYNYKELTKDLKKEGHVFKTHTDTEVIIHSYEEYGEGFLEKLNGMFAFSLYDEKKRKLIIARDRFGEKPLYYFKDENIFIYASEIKALLQYEGIARRMNDDALYKYLILRYVPTPQTLFKDIYKLPAAHYIELRPGGFFIKRYWDISFKRIYYNNESEYSEHFNELFEASVKLRMRSDVPLGAYLSSGVDSTSIVKVMSECANHKVTTYSIGCNSPGDESKDARLAAVLLKCDHKELKYDENSLDLLESIIWHMEEPVGDAHIIPTSILAQNVTGDLKVVLLGEGADESLFGYPFHKLIYYEAILRKYLPRYLIDNTLASLFRRTPFQILNMFFPLPTSIGIEGKKKLVNYFANMKTYNIVEKFVRLTSLFQPEEASKLLNHKIDENSIFDNTKLNTEKNGDIDMLMNQMFMIQMNGWLQDNILLRHDKLAMAHSIETRAPFLDHNLVEYLINIPVNMKFGNGSNKYILRNYLAGTFNKKIAYRKKIPFFAPIERFSQTGKFKVLIEKYLNEKDMLNGDIFNKEMISSLIRNNSENDFLVVKKLMSLIIIGIWRKKFNIN